MRIASASALSGSGFTTSGFSDSRSGLAGIGLLYRSAARQLASQTDLADRFARVITLFASSYLVIRIGMGLL